MRLRVVSVVPRFAPVDRKRAGAAVCAATRGRSPFKVRVPTTVLKPVPAQGANWRHALASPTAPQIPWKSDPNFLKIPDGMHFGETMGIAEIPEDQVYVFTRLGDASRLYQFDQNGAFMREIGRNSYAFTMAHGVYVDAQDFVWTIDEGTNTVIKWNPNTAQTRDDPGPAVRIT